MEKSPSKQHSKSPSYSLHSPPPFTQPNSSLSCAKACKSSSLHNPLQAFHVWLIIHHICSYHLYQEHVSSLHNITIHFLYIHT